MAVFEPPFCSKTGQEHTISNINLLRMRCEDCGCRVKVNR